MADKKVYANDADERQFEFEKIGGIGVKGPRAGFAAFARGTRPLLRPFVLETLAQAGQAQSRLVQPGPG